MVDYRRMGNMARLMGNATSATSLHQLEVWKSPRWTVIRIQALAVVAIIITFFLAAFGSCRRWSNRWIVQKGFFAAHVLSLSLGTYSIGLMQSSSVKSDMYPIWTVSLFTLFGCVDPVTAYNGLDYKGPLSKVVYGICLQFAYVLLMSISTMSSDVGNTAILILSAITFIKGFHRSFALVQQRRVRNLLQHLSDDTYGGATYVLRNGPINIKEERQTMIVDRPSTIGDGKTVKDEIIGVDKIIKIHDALRGDNDKLRSCYDMCVAFSLSRKLQQHFLRLRHRAQDPGILKGIDYKWALKVIEIELAFLYDVFFTGNAFFHYYQAKIASLWALASLIGICFVGVATAIPGTMTTKLSTASVPGCTKVLGTTTADLVITFAILVSMALLQLMHLIRCWTSNWARVAVASAYTKNQREETGLHEGEKEEEGKRKGDGGSRSHYRWAWWISLEAFVATSTNWFDKYLWQDKIGQYSIVPEGGLTGEKMQKGAAGDSGMVELLYNGCVRLVKMFGLDYIWEVVWDLLGSDTNKRPAIMLDDDVKASITDFLGKIESDRLDENWSSFSKHEIINHLFPRDSNGHNYTSWVLIWHIATRYCCEQEEKKQDALSKTEDRNRRVANVLSNNCAYLVVSAPELLPGLVAETNQAYTSFLSTEKEVPTDNEKVSLRESILLPNPSWMTKFNNEVDGLVDDGFGSTIGEGVGELLLRDFAHRPDDLWKTLADVWVRLLVYAAPYGSPEAHMQRLQQGGEFITHLWALLYHLDIREWSRFQKVRTITTVDEAERILTEDGLAVIAFFIGSAQFPNLSDELAAASRLEDGVRFYHTSHPGIANRFGIRTTRGLVLLNKGKVIQYDGEFRTLAIAHFLHANKLAFSNQAQAEETAPDIPINEQSSEDGGQSRILLELRRQLSEINNILSSRE